MRLLRPRSRNNKSSHHISILHPGLIQDADAAGDRGIGRWISLNYFVIWRLFTFLTVLVAFLALFLTRELRAQSSVVFVLAWIVAYILNGPPRWWRSWMGYVVTFTILTFLARAARNAFFPSVLDLLLFLVISKCFVLNRSRDFMLVQILSFFMLLSTAVITSSFYFAFIFVLYLFCATISLMLYGMVSERDRPDHRSRVPVGVRPHPHLEKLPMRLLCSGGVTAVLIIGLIVIFFLLIPHMSYQQINSPLSRKKGETINVTGFSEDVTLGTFKRLTPDTTVVMRVRPSWHAGGEQRRPPYLRMRGVVLDHYMGKRWMRTKRGNERTRPSKAFQIDLKTRALPYGHPMIQEIYQNSDITLRIFSASMPISAELKSNFDVRIQSATSTAQVVAFNNTYEGSYTNPFIYNVTSWIAAEGTAWLSRYAKDSREVLEGTAQYLQDLDDPEMQSARRLQFKKLPGDTERFRDMRWRKPTNYYKLSPEELLINTSLPSNDFIDRVREYSRKVAPGPTDAEIVLQATEHLRTQFTYTLEPETPPGMDALDAFLFHTKKGHCEYYATSLVLMLRTRGIPARLVNGFYTTEWNPSGAFIVRQSDAHAWVEAWIDDLGWVTMDPTPALDAGRGIYGVDKLTFLSRWSEYMRLQWQRRVIDYSKARQLQILEKLRDQAQNGILSSWIEGLRGRFSRDQNSKTRIEEGAHSADSTALSFRGLAEITWVLIVALAVFVIWMFRRAARHKSGGSPIDYMNALLKTLDRLGLRREPNQTPLEFVRSLDRPGLSLPDLEWLVGIYYRHRYHGDSPSDGDRRRARRIIGTIGTSQKPARA